MKPKRINIHRLALLGGLAGVALASSLHAATIFTDDFEGVPVPSSPGYIYGNQGGWTQSSTSAAFYWYDTGYATASAKRPDPFGNVALHSGGGGSAYNYRSTGQTFTVGLTYRLSMMAANDNGEATTNRVFFYIDDDAGGDVNDGNSLGTGVFRANGTSGSANGAFNVVNPNFVSTDNAGNWQRISFDYIATAADDGKEIRIGIWNEGNDYAFDNIILEEIPEPSSAALLGLGGLALLLRRRR